MTTRFPIVITGWTEYEREPGWGSTQRSDGISVHLTVKDALEFSRAYNAEHNNKSVTPDYYVKCDEQPEVIDADPDLYEYLQAKKREGQLGVRVYDRDDEKLVREGKNPWRPEVYGVIIRGTTPDGQAGALVDSQVPGPTRLKTARARAAALVEQGFDAQVVVNLTPTVRVQAPMVEAEEVGIYKDHGVLSPLHKRCTP